MVELGNHQTLMIFGQLSLGELPRDGRGSDHSSAPRIDRRDGERNVDQLSVLSETIDLEVLDPLATLQPPQDLRHVVGLILRKQYGEGLADGFIRRETENSLRARI